MWRERAALKGAIIAGIVIVAACVCWAILAQTLVTGACDVPNPPANAGFLDCPSSAG